MRLVLLVRLGLMALGLLPALLALPAQKKQLMLPALWIPMVLLALLTLPTSSSSFIVAGERSVSIS